MRHQSKAQLRSVIGDSGHRALQAAQHHISKSQGQMTYESFVEGLLGRGEQLLTPLHASIGFDTATIAAFKDHQEPTGKPFHWFKPGIMVLTNQRLLMMSASFWSVNEVTPVLGSQARSPSPSFRRFTVL